MLLTWELINSSSLRPTAPRREEHNSCRSMISNKIDLLWKMKWFRKLQKECILFKPWTSIFSWNTWFIIYLFRTLMMLPPTRSIWCNTIWIQKKNRFCKNTNSFRKRWFQSMKTRNTKQIDSNFLSLYKIKQEWAKKLQSSTLASCTDLLEKMNFTLVLDKSKI